MNAKAIHVTTMLHVLIELLDGAVSVYLDIPETAVRQVSNNVTCIVRIPGPIRKYH